MNTIVVDCFGGDLSPAANIDGAIASLTAGEGFKLLLTGDKQIIENHLVGKKYDSSRIEIIDAKDVISCEEQPTEAVKSKPDSSMVKGFALLKERADALISIGSTGALLVCGILKTGRIKGVLRPALSPILPTVKGGEVVFLDSGANADCKEPYLVHFALMGTIYAKTVLHKENPRVALLSNGTEDVKGNEFTKNVHKLLRERTDINFIGNIEAREILSGDCDVVVTDGFSGNIALKSMEGVAAAVFSKLKMEIDRSLRAKIGALFMKKSLYRVKTSLDYNAKGGAVLLGVNKVIIKPHGSSKAQAICAAILQANAAVNGGLVKAIAEEMSVINKSNEGV